MEAAKKFTLSSITNPKTLCLEMLRKITCGSQKRIDRYTRWVNFTTV